MLKLAPPLIGLLSEGQDIVAASNGLTDNRVLAVVTSYSVRNDTKV
jgi:hypothetical protein